MTLQTKTALDATIAANLADNTTKAITPALHRAVHTNVAAGIWGRVSTAIDNTDSPYTVDTDVTQVLLCDPTSGTITVNLPAVSGLTNPICIVNVGTTNAVTVDGDGAEEIIGATTYSLASQWDAAIFFPASTLWVVLGTK